LSERARILLVDDLPANLHTLCRALASEYDLAIATSGSSALALARDSAPDLILLDVMMPEMDGFETLRHLRQSHWGRTVPVMLVTADDRSETQVKGLDLGADDFITKPVVVPVVQARVRNLLERQQLQRELMRLATTDELTGVLNRRCLFSHGESARTMVVRYQQACGLVMLDIDYFKQVNDRYGHAVGDAVLIAFAATIGGLLRDSDHFGRIGGEEFALLLPNTDHKGTLILAERLRQAVMAMRIQNDEGESVLVTTSIGVTQLTADDLQFDDAMRRADSALYQAKFLGRNRVEVALAVHGAGAIANPPGIGA
jgi:diguanylate cyclase (GGDEF)-like protein